MMPRKVNPMRMAFAIVPALLLSLAHTALAYPQAKVAVMSDLHYYDPSLGVTGKAFLRVMDSDRKALPESRELLLQAIDDIARSDADFVLIPGDLTKDGEAVSHRFVSVALHRLTGRGKKVFVIPGNHDINNPAAQQFAGDRAEPVPTVTAQDFAINYLPFGYGGALKRDTSSLSYVAEPVPGLWLLALDSCRYGENGGKAAPLVGGRLTPETQAWIRATLKEAQASGKAVIAMMHHGVLEHFRGQKGKFGDYLVKDNMKIAALLAKNGCRVVFTGHFHAQDVADAMVAGGAFTDVETGSLVTYPNPWRMVEFSDDFMRISSRDLTSIPSRPDLQEYSRELTLAGLKRESSRSLRKYRVSRGDIKLLAPQIAQRFLLHYKGDEPRGTKPVSTKGVSLWGRIICFINSRLMKGISTDGEPDDLNPVVAF